MPYYIEGKIYKIVNDIDDKIYIGSTCNPLHKRFFYHKNKASKSGCKFLSHMKLIGPPHFRIILVERYPCASKNELSAREEYWIKELKPELNGYSDTDLVSEKDSLSSFYKENPHFKVRPAKQTEQHIASRIKSTQETCARKRIFRLHMEAMELNNSINLRGNEIDKMCQMHRI